MLVRRLAHRFASRRRADTEDGYEENEGEESGLERGYSVTEREDLIVVGKYSLWMCIPCRWWQR